MPINRTWWNNLVDDDGSGALGTVWNKATIAGLLDAIDGMVEVGKVWTPQLFFGGGNAGMAFSTKVGGYSRADEIVTCEARFVLTAKGSSTGIATITGFPYLPKASFNPVVSIDPEYQFAGLAGAVGGIMIGASVYLIVPTASGRNTLSDANFTNATQFNLSVTYRKQ